MIKGKIKKVVKNKDEVNVVVENVLKLDIPQLQHKYKMLKESIIKINEEIKQIEEIAKTAKIKLD